ncbi:hypothetical protein FH972_009789 [Carpinus fangiana]|uniref:Uncharacterized protein n=1 Tax=Carpinus fangiana TaxID=176857 RepID=A0A660KLA6_9ROSI|nr:hypothetical protein FH972_009789 [Carpinus fangiana]
MNHNNKSSSASPPPPSTHPTPSDSSPFASILQTQLRPLVSRQWGLHQSHRISGGCHFQPLRLRASPLRPKPYPLQNRVANQRLCHGEARTPQQSPQVITPGACYEAVIQQCEHALLMQNPTGPASSVDKSKKRLMEIIEKSQAKIILLEWRQLLEAEVTVEFKAMQQRDLVGNHAAEKKTDKVDVKARQELGKSKDHVDVGSSEQQHSEPPQTYIAWFLMLFRLCDVSSGSGRSRI